MSGTKPECKDYMVNRKPWPARKQCKFQRREDRLNDWRAKAMLTIDSDNRGQSFIVRQKDAGMGRGMVASAKDEKAVALCVEHYFGKNRRHEHHGLPGGVRGCPFCKAAK